MKSFAIAAKPNLSGSICLQRSFDSFSFAGLDDLGLLLNTVSFGERKGDEPEELRSSLYRESNADHQAACTRVLKSMLIVWSVVGLPPSQTA